MNTTSKNQWQYGKISGNTQAEENPIHSKTNLDSLLITCDNNIRHSCD